MTGLQGLQFSQRMFFELESSQANTINFREGEKRTSLRFHRSRPWQTLRFEVPVEEK